jgi:lysine-specific demethylase 8
MKLQPVAQVTQFTPEGFHDQFVGPSRPVVLRGAAGDWPSVRYWTFDRLRARFGDQRMRVRGSDRALDVFFGAVTEREMSFAEYLDAILSDQVSGRRPYLGNFLLNHPQMDAAVLQLLDDARFPPLFPSLPEMQIRIWVAGPGQQSTVHNDNYENLNAQIIGRKRFILFPPESHERLYARKVNDALWSSPIDTEAPQLDLYPGFEGIEGQQCELEAGDILFIPKFWWHQAISTTASINLNSWYYIDAVTDETWEDRLFGARQLAAEPALAERGGG